MNPLEERLNQLETRVTRYRNFNILLCLLLVAVVTVATTDGVSPFQSKLTPDPIPMPEGNVGIPDLPNSDIPVAIPDVHRAGKMASQIQGVIRTRGLQIVNSDGQAVVELWPSTVGGGLIFVNSPEGKQLVYIGSLAASGNGVVHVNSTEEKNQIALGSNSETGDGRIWIRNRNEDILISLNTHERYGSININRTGNQLLAYLGADLSGNARLSLLNNLGVFMALLETGETAGNLRLANNNNKWIARLGAYSGGDGVLNINSKTGTELITAGSNTNDNGLIRVSNSYGTLGVYIVGSNEHGYVGLQDAQERILAELTATAGGNGLVRTLSPEGITTWSSNSVQVNTGSSLRGDMDNDGDIDGDDFLIFSENFGKKR